MTSICKEIKNSLLVVLLLLFNYSVKSQNLLANGDFESGGNGVGFSLNGAGYNLISAPFSGNTSPGNYAFTTNPLPMNTANFILSSDHTSGVGNMMIIDGNTTGGSQRFWRAGNTGGGVCGLTIGATYTFSYWIRSVSNTVTGISTQADIGIQFNNVSSFTLSGGNTIAPLPANGWQQVVYNFVPSNSCVNIELWNNNTNPVGNDFAVDDFAVIPPALPLSITYSIKNSSCYNSDDASIVAYGVGGTQPYVSYTLSGPMNATNTTGVFTGLIPGVYTVSVTDSNLPATVVVSGPITLTEPQGLTLNSPATICSGANVNLNVSGGTSYVWTASPSDPTLINPNSANPTVSPTITTTYSVTSTTTSPTSANLIYNGDFSIGNAGFVTDYQYIAVSNSSGAQTTYGITTNSNSWFNLFSSCVDHTTGTGNMMVVDGSNVNGGNNRLWCQTIPVNVGQNYTFSYWIQTVGLPSPANIDVVINGVSIGTSIAPGAVCGWSQVTYNWNSGTNTVAQICIYDRNVSQAGNDFAIDDLVFTTNIVCNLSGNVTVTVSPVLSPVVSCGNTTANSINFTWNSVSGATGYTINYTVNGGTPISGGSVASTSYTVSGLGSSSTVVITVTPIGAGCYGSDTQSCTNTTTCPTPVASVTVQPTCTIPTGTIVVTSPLNGSSLPIPTDLFISEVTDEDIGALTYVEIFNGTGGPKNLANYKLKIYNNGNAFTSCEFPLSGTLNNNSVYVISVGSVVNQGGVTPDLVVSTCAGVNTNDNIRLTTSADVEIDLWGRTDGVDFTPALAAGYTYRRLTTAPHPSMIWNAADWTDLDPQDYTEVGSYVYQTTIYEYSVNGVNYQSSPTFTGLAPNTYNVTVRDIVSGCVSNAITLVVNPAPINPTAAPILFCDVPNPNITPPPVSFDFNNVGQTSFTYSYTIDGGAPVTGTIVAPSHFDVTGATQGQAVVFTLTWNGVCTPSQTVTCYPPCVTPVTPSFTQVAAICTGQSLSALPTTSNNGVLGTWSPALNNTATTTYTFTPNPGECATTTTMTITVNSTITPTFAQVAPICSGAVLSSLPTTSNNGVNGTWSPAVNNTATTTYTFTPAVGQCASTATMTITVNPNVTPTFTQVAPICSGAVLSLPTTSNNGISGTWSPAINNIATTTYTFTPSVGQCATTNTMTITVNPNITPTFTQVAPICSGAVLNSLPTTSNNGINGTWSPAINNTATTTYTFTPSVGQCATTATMTITVNPNVTPTFTQVAPICSGAVLSSLPTTSNNGINGSWSPAINNTATTTYTFTPSVGQCAVATTMQIVVFPTAAPTLNIQQNCGSNTVIVLNPIGTNYEYSLDGGAYQTNPTFSNISAGNHSIVAHQSITNCTTSAANFVINNFVNDVIVFNPSPLVNCDSDDNDGISTFDLTQVIPFVTGGNSYNVTFHETQTDALVDATSIPSPNAYANIDQWSQTIYIRVESLTSSCFEVVSLQLIVHPKPIAVEPTDLHECDDNYDGFTVFNLTDKTAEILGSINPVTHSINYYESLADAQVPQNTIGSPTSYINTVANTQTIWVRVETITTGCFDIVELQLVVDPLPLVNQPACTAYTICDINAPIGFEQFNLQTKVDCILQGQLGMSVTFYPSLLNAQNNTNVISNLQYTNIVAYVQTLGIRVTDDATGCYVISTMDIRVDPLPVPIAPLSAYEVCDTDQNGIYEFDLTTLSAGILGANPSGNVISYHETQTDAQTGTNAISLTQPYFNIIPYLQTLWVNVTNPATGCFGVIPIQIKVNESPRMPDLADLVYCDEDSNNQNGITSINLAQQTPLILAAQTILPISNYTVTYYTSLLDAQQQVNNIINTTTFTGTNQTIWVVVEHNITGCTKIGDFDIIVNIPLALTPPPALSVCDDDNQPNNTFTTFDLTIREAVITQGLPGYTVTYYPSYANALAHTNAILNPTAYVNTQAAVQTLGIMVTSPAGCRSYTTMDIRVLPVPTPNRTNIPILTPQCEDAVGSGQQFFDITVNQNYILNNDPNVTAHYFHTLADATAVPPVNEILNPTNAYIGDPAIAGQVPRPVNYVQNIYIAVTSNLFTEYTGQNCYVIVEQPFIINPLPIVKVIGEQQICEEDPLGNDGIEVFDLTSYNSDLLSLNNTTPASSYTVNFYTDLGYTNLITNPTSYSNVTNPQTIYVSITATDTYVDPVTGITHTTSCTSRDKFDIRVNPKPTITQPANPLATCDVNDSQNDGYDENYLLSSLESEILNGQDPTQFTVTFYDSEYNPDATPPLVPTPLNVASYDVYTHTYWAAVTNNATGCFKTTSFNVVVEQTPEPFITNDPQLNVICVDYNTHQVVRPLLLETVNQTIPYLVNQPNYTYEWFEDGVAIANSNSSTLLIDFALNDNTSSIFTVVMTSDTALGCSDVSQNYLVIQSGQATPITGTIGYTVTNAFTDNQIITVTVDGYGTYQYSLDDGPRQDSPVFEYVSLGEHIITVWDTEGGIENSCDPLIIENVQTIDYPLYFTPNGDGVHETWNIVGLDGQPDAKIYIFDRHGKLIKQISSAGAGWDGTYNGQQMPSTDYWFTVDYREQQTVKQFKAHFSLKR